MGLAEKSLLPAEGIKNYINWVNIANSKIIVYFMFELHYDKFRKKNKKNIIKNIIKSK